MQFHKTQYRGLQRQGNIQYFKSFPWCFPCFSQVYSLLCLDASWCICGVLSLWFTDWYLHWLRLTVNSMIVVNSLRWKPTLSHVKQIQVCLFQDKQEVWACQSSVIQNPFRLAFCQAQRVALVPMVPCGWKSSSHWLNGKREELRIYSKCTLTFSGGSYIHLFLYLIG